VHSHHYIVGAVAIALLIWGPLDHDDPWGMVVRAGYLILVPLVLWFVLKWVWKQWRPDEAAEDRLQRTLFGVTSGVFLAGIIACLEDGYQKGRGDGGDTDAILLLLIFGVLFFYLSVTKIQNERD